MCVYTSEYVDVFVWIHSRKLGVRVRQRGRTFEEGKNRQAQEGGKRDTGKELQ